MGDLSQTDTDCFKRAIITANALKTMFDLNYFENNSFNFADAYNFGSVIGVKYIDQFQACQYDLLLEQVESRLTPQVLYLNGKPMNYVLIDYTAMLAKLLMNLCVLLVEPELSDLYVSY